ncbi:UNVERIFIED_ORG: hypothetical protein B2H93_13490 [Clostridium botulinum]
MENIVLYSNNIIEISESQDDSYLNVKFIICNFEPNKNNVMLNRETIDNWLKTLVMKPLVGRIKLNKDNELDFTSHEAKKVHKFINGNLESSLKFGTEAFGTFEAVQIETIDNIEYITANARVWKRFENCCNIIQERFDNNEPLNTSWEISIIDSVIETVNSKQIKVINDGIFIGHALLSKYTSPAYDCSGMLEVAEEQHDEFAEAFLQDLNDINKIKNQTEQSVDNKLKEKEGGHENIMADENKNIEISSLTMGDLYSKVGKAIRKSTDEDKWYYISYLYPIDFKAIAHSYDDDETKYVEFTYSVSEEGTVSITGKKEVEMVFIPKSENETIVSELQTSLSTKETELSTKVDEIVKLGETIKDLETTISEKDTLISELTPYKEQIEKAEEEKQEAKKEEKKKELSEMLVSSKYFTSEEIETSEEIKNAISELNESVLKNMIADKVIAEASKKKEQEDTSGCKKKTEKAEVEVSSTTDLNAETKYNYTKSGNVLLDILNRNK